MRNRHKTLLRDHSVPEVTLKACPKDAQSQPNLRPSPFKDLNDLPDVECPYKWSITGFSLNLVALKPMLEVSVLKTGPDAPAVWMETSPQEGVGQWEKLEEEIKSMGDGDTVVVEDAPP